MRHLFQYKPVRVPVACMMAVTHAQTVALSTRLLEGALKGRSKITACPQEDHPQHTHTHTDLQSLAKGAELAVGEQVRRHKPVHHLDVLFIARGGEER